jgi:hypothetical protein
MDANGHGQHLLRGGSRTIRLISAHPSTVVSGIVYLLLMAVRARALSRCDIYGELS